VTGQTDPQDGIVDAIDQNDTAQLQQLCRQGVRVTRAEPLIYCAYIDVSLDMVRCLVNDLGADVNGESEDGVTALTMASSIWSAA
jgi:hypothetical protein